MKDSNNLTVPWNELSLGSKTIAPEFQAAG